MARPVIIIIPFVGGIVADDPEDTDSVSIDTNDDADQFSRDANP